MVTMVEIKAAYDSAKAAFQIAEGVGALKSEAAKNAAIIDIQRNVVDAQRGLSAALERIDELEKEIVQLKSWATENERYELKEFPTGALAYALKPSEANGRPLHSLCPNCYDSDHKAMLQPIARHSGGELVECLRCNARLTLSEFRSGPIDYGDRYVV